MEKVKEIRCPVHGKLLFKIIDYEYIEVWCDKCKKRQRYKIPRKPLTQNNKISKMILN